MGLHSESTWRPRRGVSRRQLPRGLRSWLEETASLTRRIQAHSDEPLKARVLNERWARPSLSEARQLGLPATRYARIREILLRDGEGAWIYARTVMPLSTLRGARRRLLRLGERPLGHLVFGRGRGSGRRSSLLIAKVEVDEALGREIARHTVVDGPLWARRSLLQLEGRPLLVTEVFLPRLVAQALEGES